MKTLSNIFVIAFALMLYNALHAQSSLIFLNPIEIYEEVQPALKTFDQEDLLLLPGRPAATSLPRIEIQIVRRELGLRRMDNFWFWHKGLSSGWFVVRGGAWIPKSMAQDIQIILGGVPAQYESADKIGFGIYD